MLFEIILAANYLDIKPLLYARPPFPPFRLPRVLWLSAARR